MPEIDFSLPATTNVEPTREHFFNRGNIVVMFMVALQLAWLMLIYLLGITTIPAKIPLMFLFTILAGAFLLFMPVSWEQSLARGWQILLHSEKRTIYIMLGLVLMVGIVFATQQRIWAFDEEGNVQAATVVAEEGLAAFFQGYGERRWLGAQHPPLVPLMYGAVMAVFGSTLFVGRLVSLFFMVAAGFLTYRIGNKLFQEPVGLLGALFFFTMPLVYRLGAAAMVEMPLVFFFLLAIYLTLQLVDRPSFSKVLLIGLAVGAGTLSKYTMVIVLPIVFGIIGTCHSWKLALKYAFTLTAVFGLLMLLWLWQAEDLAVLTVQWQTVVHYASLVLTNEYGRQVLMESMTNRLPSALGVYLLPIITLSLFALGKDWRQTKAKKRWMQTVGVLLMWIGVVWLVLILTLPDHRYFMVSFPGIALFLGVGLQRAQLAGDRQFAGLHMAQVSLLSILLGMSTLYLYVDWARSSLLFIE